MKEGKEGGTVALPIPTLPLPFVYFLTAGDSLTLFVPPPIPLKGLYVCLLLIFQVSLTDIGV